MSPEHIFGIDRTQWGRWHLDDGDLVFHGAPENPGLDYVIKVEALAAPQGVWAWIRQLEESRGAPSKTSGTSSTPRSL